MSLSPIKLAAMALSATALLAACTKSSNPSGDVAAGPAGAAGAAAERIVIDDGAFDPGVLELPAGEEVVIEVTNEDGAAHDFAIDDLNLNTGTIDSGGIATARFTVPEGSTKFRCTFHDGMDGRIEAR